MHPIALLLSFLFLLHPFKLADAKEVLSRATHASIAREAPIPKRGALFKVSNQRHQLFLFGTIHIGAADFYPLEPIVQNALANASVVALEINPLDIVATQRALQQAGLYQESEVDQFTLPPRLQQRVASLSAQVGMSRDGLKQMKPWLIANTLTTLSLTSDSYQPSLGVDIYIARIAEALNKPLIALESVASQLAPFNQLSHATQVDYLRRLLDEIENGTARRRAQEIIAIWQQADSDGLDALSGALDRDTSTIGTFFKKGLLDHRHPQLTKRIAELLEQQDNGFVGIGLLHLTGAHGVPALLQKQGYQVDRLY